MDSISSSEVYRQGASFKSGEMNFSQGIVAAVDYRGDVTVELKDGTKLEGYVYSFDKEALQIFPKSSPRAVRLLLKSIDCIVFSGPDTASGTGWDDWMKKK